MPEKKSPGERASGRHDSPAGTPEFLAGPGDALTDILCCPNCRGDLEVTVPSSCLSCRTCGESYTSSQGIWEMFRAADVRDQEFVRYRADYEEHARVNLASPAPDVTQWSWLRSLSEFIGSRENSLVLDVGAADGKLGELLRGKVICFDVSLAYLKAAREKGLPAVAGRAEALPFKKVFDAAVLSNILEHVPAPEALVDQLSHVLKPGGSLYVAVPYKEDLEWYEDEDVLDPHLTSFDFHRIERLLKDFRITRHKFILFTDSRPLYFLKTRLKRLSPSLYDRLRRLKNNGGPAKAAPFPEWRHSLNYLPGALVRPFLRPYLILIEAERIETLRSGE